MLEKTIEVNRQFDKYSNLLTEKQRLVFRCYYHRDWSLSEIAEDINCSRQAVHDLLRRVIDKLTDFEEKLGLVAKSCKRRQVLDKLNKKLDSSGDKEESRLLVEKLSNL